MADEEGGVELRSPDDHCTRPGVTGYYQPVSADAFIL